MPEGQTALRRAAVAELRVALAAIRCAVQLLVHDVAPPAKPLGLAILRAVTRGERAVERLDDAVNAPEPPSRSSP
jgi:hypothetical protein